MTTDNGRRRWRPPCGEHDGPGREDGSRGRELARVMTTSRLTASHGSQLHPELSVRKPSTARHPSSPLSSAILISSLFLSTIFTAVAAAVEGSPASLPSSSSLAPTVFSRRTDGDDPASEFPAAPDDSPDSLGPDEQDLLAALLEASGSNGVYRFKFDAGNHYRKESKVDDGKVQGEFGFHGGDGFLRVLEYEADERGGFRVLKHRRIPSTEDGQERAPKLAEVSFDSSEFSGPGASTDGLVIVQDLELLKEGVPSPSLPSSATTSKTPVNHDPKDSVDDDDDDDDEDPQVSSGAADVGTNDLLTAVVDDDDDTDASPSSLSQQQQWRFTTPSLSAPTTTATGGGRLDRKLFRGPLLPNLGDIDFGQITPLQLPQRIYDRLHSRGPYVAHQEDVKYAFALNLEDHMNELELEGLVALPHIPPVDVSPPGSSSSSTKTNKNKNNNKANDKNKRRPGNGGGGDFGDFGNAIFRRRKRQTSSGARSRSGTTSRNNNNLSGNNNNINVGGVEGDKNKKETYGFGYQAPFHGHEEKGFDDGSKKGTFYWDGPDGYRRIVTYIADEKGFRPKIVKVPIPTPPPPTPSPIRPQPGKRDGRELGDVNDSDFVIDEEGRRSRRGRESRPYKFSYNVGTHYHVEEGFANGTRIGEYAVVQPDARRRTVTYVADDAGFRPRVAYAAATVDELRGRLRLPAALAVPADLFALKPLAVNSVDFVLDFRQSQRKIVVARLVPKNNNDVPDATKNSTFAARSGAAGPPPPTTTELSVFPTSARNQRRVSGQRTFRDPVGKVLKFGEPISTSAPVRNPAAAPDVVVRQTSPQDLESLRLNQLRRQELGRVQALRNVQANERRRTSTNVLDDGDGNNELTISNNNNNFGGRTTRLRNSVVRGQLKSNVEQEQQFLVNRSEKSSDRSQFQRAIKNFNSNNSPAAATAGAPAGGQQTPAFGKRLVTRRPVGVTQRQFQKSAPIIPVPIFNDVSRPSGAQTEEEIDLPNFVPLTIGVGRRPGDPAKDVSDGKSSSLPRRDSNSGFRQFQGLDRQQGPPALLTTLNSDPAVTTFRPASKNNNNDVGSVTTDAVLFQSQRQQQQQVTRRQQQPNRQPQQQQRFFFNNALAVTSTSTPEAGFDTETTTTATATAGTTFAFRNQQNAALQFRPPLNSLKFSDPLTTEQPTSTFGFTSRPVTTTGPPAFNRFTTQRTFVQPQQPLQQQGRQQQQQQQRQQTSGTRGRSLFPTSGTAVRTSAPRANNNRNAFTTSSFFRQQTTTTVNNNLGFDLTTTTTTEEPESTTAPRRWPSTTTKAPPVFRTETVRTASFWNPTTATATATTTEPPTRTATTTRLPTTTTAAAVKFGQQQRQQPQIPTTTNSRRRGKALGLPLDPVTDVPRQTNAIFLGARIESTSGHGGGNTKRRDPDVQDVPPYKFSYDVGTHYHQEESDAERKVVRGKYGILDANGILREIEYYVDETGFHPIVRRKDLRALARNAQQSPEDRGSSSSI